MVQKEIGFLYCREGISLAPVLHGGEQERKRRAGTESVPAIVGFAKAAQIAQTTMSRKQELYQQYQELKC